MNELTIIKYNGGAYIDSREVAVFIGKDHRNLLRDIRGYCEIMRKSNELRFELINFFVESSYVDSRGREKSCFLLTKKGCELCANKLSGTKGVLFTAAYVSKFNAMEAAEREAEIKSHARPRLSEFNTAVKNVLNGMSQAYVAPDGVMKFLCGVYEPLGIEVLPFHETDYIGYYNVTEIAAKVGVYSASGRPHGHAVSAIIAGLDNRAFMGHAMVIPYGLVGATFRYDSFIVEAVRNWLAENKFPHIVPYLDFDYHVYYHRQMSLFDDFDDFDDDTILDLDDDLDDYPDDYTAEELDEMCGKFGDCDECPGFAYCCESD